METATIAALVRRIIETVEIAVVGKRATVEQALAVLLSSGHLLVEDIPGVGKTTLAKALARSIGCEFKRVQFTPDLLPSDVTGTSVFNQKTGDFEFREGPVFANIVLADEINRATPKTQSALLECMEERQVTVDGITYPLPSPFFVIATQNTVEMAGTYPLPEAQLDRFTARISIGYPSRVDELAILHSQIHGKPVETIEPVVTAADIVQLQKAVREIHIDLSLQQYALELVAASRNHPEISLGASPRGTLYLVFAAQALAAIKGSQHVLPDHVKAMAVPVLAHRIFLKPETRMRGLNAAGVVAELLKQVPVPVLP